MTTALEGVNLTVRRGEMVAVVGSVGAGKSSLLAAACGQCLMSRGRVRTAPQLAAVPQRPFVIAGSLLDNVLLGRALDRARLREVLQASALDTDLAALPLGELTEVGVRVRVRVRVSHPNPDPDPNPNPDPDPNPNPNPNQVGSSSRPPSRAPSHCAACMPRVTASAAPPSPLEPLSAPLQPCS